MSKARRAVTVPTEGIFGPNEYHVCAGWASRLVAWSWGVGYPGEDSELGLQGHGVSGSRAQAKSLV